MKYLIALIAFLSTLNPQLSTLAQAPATTAQPLARDATSFNLNRTRLDFGSGQTLKLESGSVFSLENGATFSIGGTAAADLKAALALGSGNATFATAEARNATTPDAVGQLGVQLDTGSLWRASSTTAGDWSGAFQVGSLASTAGVSGTTGTFSGAVSGTTGIFSDAVSGTTGTFSGAVSGTTGTFSDAVSGTTGTFSDAVSGTTGTFSGAVSGTTGTFSGAVSGTTGTFSGAVSGTTGTFSGDVTGGGFSLIKANSSGTAAAPFFTRATDTDTGLYFPGANQVSISAGGAQVGAFTTGGLAVTGSFGASGAVSGTNGTFSGAVSGTTGTFSSAVSGTTGTFSGVVSAATTMELGHASDTTLARVSAGVVSIEGATVRTGTVAVANGGTGVTALPKFLAYMSGNQSIATSTMVKVAFDTETFDTNSSYDNATNYRFTPTVAGKYLVGGHVYWANTAGAAGVSVFVRKNGADYARLDQKAGSATISIMGGSTLVDLNGSTDYLEFFVYQDSGGSLSISASSSITQFWASMLP